MAHRCVSLGAFTARSERYGHHVVGGRASTERRPLAWSNRLRGSMLNR
jgi:hypothetical protein